MSNGEKILVIGSLNMDMSVKTPYLPKAGETVLGDEFTMAPGGKGANQAVAAARLGCPVTMLGRVGKDLFGEQLVENLRNNGISTDLIITDSSHPTGVALINIDEQAENSIVVASGANKHCTPEDLQVLGKTVDEFKILMLQLEIPLQTVEAAAKLAKQHGLTVILDPAPARQLPSSLLQLVDIITPNETEAFILTGLEVHDAESAKAAAAVLLAQGVKNVVIKLGAKGALWAAENRSEHLPGEKVNAIDTTAAGDAFGGGLAAGLAAGQDMLSALKFANKVGALATTKRGAQPSLPTLQEVEAYFA